MGCWSCPKMLSVFIAITFVCSSASAAFTSLRPQAAIEAKMATAIAAGYAANKNAGFNTPMTPANPAAVRITTEFQYPQNVSSNATATKVQAAAAAAVTVVSSYLQTRFPVAGNLLINPMCFDNTTGTSSFELKGCGNVVPEVSSGTSTNNMCYDATINPAHVAAYTNCTAAPGAGCVTYGGGAGVATDFYLYVVTGSMGYCADKYFQQGLGYFSGYGSACGFAALPNGLARPAMGAISLCDYWVADSATTEDDVAEVLVHELLHTLGFAGGPMMDLWLNDDGTRKTGHWSSAVSAFSNLTQISISEAVIVAAAAKHFACPTMTALNFEDEGPDGARLHHLEMWQFKGDIMCASSPPDGTPAVVSDVTLTIMQQTGWYKAAKAGQALPWGAAAGCPFVENCTTYAAANPNKFFCPSEASDGGNRCGANAMGWGMCMDTPFTDRCALLQTYGNNCDMNLFGMVSNFGAVDSPTSRCVDTKLPLTRGNNTYSDTTGTSAPICYPVVCTEGALAFTVAGVNVPCPTGQTVDLAKVEAAGFSAGVLVCPDNAVVCGTVSCPKSCSGNGVCVGGACSCMSLYSGEDCSLRAVPAVSAPSAPPPPYVDATDLIPAPPPPPEVPVFTGNVTFQVKFYFDNTPDDIVKVNATFLWQVHALLFCEPTASGCEDMMPFMNYTYDQAFISSSGISTQNTDGTTNPDAQKLCLAVDLLVFPVTAEQAAESLERLNTLDLINTFINNMYKVGMRYLSLTSNVYDKVQPPPMVAVLSPPPPSNTTDKNAASPVATVTASSLLSALFAALLLTLML